MGKGDVFETDDSYQMIICCCYVMMESMKACMRMCEATGRAL